MQSPASHLHSASEHRPDTSQYHDTPRPGDHGAQLRRYSLQSRSSAASIQSNLPSQILSPATQRPSPHLNMPARHRTWPQAGIEAVRGQRTPGDSRWDTYWSFKRRSTRRWGLLCNYEPSFAALTPTLAAVLVPAVGAVELPIADEAAGHTAAVPAPVVGRQAEAHCGQSKVDTPDNNTPTCTDTLPSLV